MITEEAVNVGTYESWRKKKNFPHVASSLPAPQQQNKPPMLHAGNIRDASAGEVQGGTGACAQGAVKMPYQSTVGLTWMLPDTGANASAEGGDDEALEDTAVKVNNIVHSFRLQSTQFDKKGYLAYLKGASNP